MPLPWQAVNSSARKISSGVRLHRVAIRARKQLVLVIHPLIQGCLLHAGGDLVGGRPMPIGASPDNQESPADFGPGVFARGVGSDASAPSFCVARAGATLGSLRGVPLLLVVVAGDKCGCRENGSEEIGYRLKSLNETRLTPGPTGWHQN